MDLTSINRFLRKLNETSIQFSSFKKGTTSKEEASIDKAKADAKTLKQNMRQKLDSYIKENFTSIKESTLTATNLLINKFPYLYRDATASTTFNINSDFDEIKSELFNKVNLLNNKIVELNKTDFNSLIPKKELRFDGKEKFEVSFNGTIKNYDTSSYKETYDEKIAIELIDKETIKTIFSCVKDIERMSDLLAKIYEKQFKIEEFNEKVDNICKNYTSELYSDATSKIKARLYNDFESNEVNENFSSFFESLDNITKESVPDVENGTDLYKENIVLGNLSYKALDNIEYYEFCKRSKVLCERIDNKGFIKVPFIADLRHKGNFFIDTNDNRYSENLKAFVNQLILAFLLSFPARRIHFKLIDINDKMSFAPLSALRKINDNILLSGIVRDINQLDDAINDVKNIKFNSEDKLGAEGITNIFDYNKKYDTSPMDVYVQVVTDYPSGFNTTTASKLRDIMINGKNDGVFTIVINNNSISLDDYNFPTEEYTKIIAEMKDCSYCFETNPKLIYTDENNKKYEINPLKNLTINNLSKIVEVLKERSKEEISKPIELTDMFDYIDNSKSKSISVEMEIPFGQSGGDVQTLLLTNQSGPHAALIGTSGSGKSVLFHTLILDACYKYSPEELNFYLLDFKGGVEFKYYQNNKLPHIKVIGLTNDLYDGLSILASINNEILERKRLFNEIGVSNIESYYSAGKKIPRLFIIIDEIQEILVRDDKVGEKALNILSEILAIGRSFGINVLWGSQSVPFVSGIDNKIMNNITNRICLKVANADYAMRLFDNPASLRAVENLNRPGIIGLGVIKDERTGSSVKEFRVAYSEKGEKRDKYVEMIKQKWSNVVTKDDLFVIGDDMIPDEKECIHYNTQPSTNDIFSKSFETYWLGLGTDYVLGKYYPIEIANSKERENMVIVGTNIDLLRDMMGYFLLSVILNRLTDRDCLSTRFSKVYYANKEGVNPKFSNDLFNLLPKIAEEQIEMVGSAEKFTNCIKDLYHVYKQRKEAMDNSQIPNNYYPIYLFIHSIQYFNDLFEENKMLDNDGFMSFEEVSAEPAISFVDAFKTLTRKGSQCGIHFVISTNSIDAIREIKDNLKEFNYKIATVGSNPTSFIDRSASQIPVIDNDRVAVIMSNEQINKFRPYRYNEQSLEEELWVKDLIQKYTNI